MSIRGFMKRSAMIGAVLVMGVANNAALAATSFAAAAPTYTWQKNAEFGPVGCPPPKFAPIHAAVSGGIVYVLSNGETYLFEKDSGKFVSFVKNSGRVGADSFIYADRDGKLYTSSFDTDGMRGIVQPVDVSNGVVLDTVLDIDLSEKKPYSGFRGIGSGYVFPMTTDLHGNYYFFDVTDDNDWQNDRSYNHIISAASDGTRRYDVAIPQGSGVGQLSARPVAIAADASGQLYVPDDGNDRVAVFNPDGTYKKTIGTSGSGSGQFSGPTGVTIASNGDIYVADTGNNRIQVFNSDGSYKTQFGTTGSGDGQLSSPLNIVFDDDGNGYVVDHDNGRIEVFNPDGTYKSQITYVLPTQPDPSLLCGMQGSTTDLSGNTYVIDYDWNNIKEYDANGKFIQIVGADSDIKLNDPRVMTIDKASNLYVIDADRNQNVAYVVSFSPGGKYINRTELKGYDVGAATQGMLVDGGELYMIKSSAIEVYDLNGAFLRTIGADFSSDWSYYTGAVLVDDKENLYAYLSDFDGMGDSGLLMFDKNGKFSGKFGENNVGDGAILRTQIMSTDAAGNIYMTDGGIVKVYDKTGGYLTSFSAYGTGDGQAMNISSMTVSPSGVIYLTDNIPSWDDTPSHLSIWTTPVAPLSPIDIVVTTPSTTSAVVSWRPAPLSAIATSYLVRYRAVGSTMWQSVTVAGTETSAVINGLDPDQAYEFTAVAINAVGQAEPSAITTATTPANVVAVAINNAAGALASTGINMWLLVIGAPLLTVAGGVLLARRRS